MGINEGGRVLDSIDEPADLRGLNPRELEQLAAEIRRLIVQSVSVQGGHLGSNLGVVELTLAIHRVFDSPRDIILWDTGHQAYAHKVVTGRRSRFTTLRQRAGLAGYPSRAESGHDWVENSHASTILSYAHGLATADAVRGRRDRRIVAVLGDGALTGGMTYEALNNLGHDQTKVLIVLNDNGRSYAPTVGPLARVTPQSVSAARVMSRTSIQRALQEIPKGDEYPDVGGEGRAMARDPAWRRRRLAAGSLGPAFTPEVTPHPGRFFESLGIRYVGPLDGHDVAALERVLGPVSEYEGPAVVHVLTDKGRGYGPAEGDEEACLHDVPAFDPILGPPSWSPVGYTKVFSETMLEIGERDRRVIAVTAAMAGPTGLRPFERRWPDRLVDVGIAEQHAVTAAAGLAMGGLRPFVAIYSSFLTRAFDQINLDVGLHRLPVVLCIDRAGITGDDGPSHNGTLDLALLCQVPNMTILAPSCAEELRVMLHAALAIEAPVAIRYPKGPARSVPLGGGVVGGLRARMIRGGSDVCILAVGKMVEAATEAARLLTGHGLSATVWDLRVVKPLDRVALASAVTHRLVVTVEDGVRHGGAGTAIAAALAEEPSHWQPPPVLMLGVPDEYLTHGPVAAILSELGLDAAGLAASVLSAMGSNRICENR